MAARRVSLGYWCRRCSSPYAPQGPPSSSNMWCATSSASSPTTEEKIEQERWAVQADRADLAYLSRPDRLVMQAQQLGLVEAEGGRVVTRRRSCLTGRRCNGRRGRCRRCCLPAPRRAPGEADADLRPSSAWRPTDGGAAVRSCAIRAADPALEKGRGRLRIVGGVFALAFLSIGLRLLDMVGWRAEGVTEIARRPDDWRFPPSWLVPTSSIATGSCWRPICACPGVHADPSRLADKAAAAAQLAAILPGVDAAQLRRRFETGGHFAWIKHRITPEEQQAVLDLGLPGVGFSMAEHRVYPKGNARRPCARLRIIDGAASPGSSAPSRLSSPGRGAVGAEP